MNQSILCALCVLGLPLAGCLKDAKDGKIPGEAVIETGYLSCAVVSEACPGEMRCVEDDGDLVCLPLPAACGGALTCACFGDTMCGGESCVSLGGGIACEPAPSTDGIHDTVTSDQSGATDTAVYLPPDSGTGLDTFRLFDASDTTVGPTASCADVGQAICNGWVERGPISTNAQLIDVWQRADGDVWAVSTGGGLWHWDGEVLEIEFVDAEASVFATDLWGDGDTLWITTANGEVRRRTAAGWHADELAKGARLNAIRGSANDAVWAVGTNGLVGHWDGSTWTVSYPHATASFKDVWVQGGKAYVAGTVEASSGERTVVYESTPSGWLQIHDGLGEAQALWGDGTTLWLGGRLNVAAGLLRHYAGGQWSEEQPPPDSLGVRHLAGRGEELWAAGSQFWHRPHGEWEGVASPFPGGGTLGGVNGIVAAGAGIAYAGAGGRIFRVEAGTVTLIGKSWRHIHGMDGAGPGDVWAVGQQGLVAHWDGQVWRFEDRESGDLRGVWRAPNGDLWAVGDAGVAWHRSSATGEWSRHDAPTSARLTAVWGWTTDRVWASALAGDEDFGDATGELYEWNGVGWTAALTGPLPGLRAITGTPGVETWVVGRGDTLFHYDGVAWRTLTLDVAANLNEANSPGPGRLLAGGAPDVFDDAYTGLVVTVADGEITITPTAHNEQIAALWGDDRMAIAVDASSHLWWRTEGDWEAGPRLDLEFIGSLSTRLWSDGERLWLYGLDGFAHRSATLSELRSGLGVGP